MRKSNNIFLGGIGRRLPGWPKNSSGECRKHSVSPGQARQEVWLHQNLRTAAQAWVLPCLASIPQLSVRLAPLNPVIVLAWHCEVVFFPSDPLASVAITASKVRDLEAGS